MTAASRTYAATADGGTYGQHVPAVEAPAWPPGTVLLPGLAHSPDAATGFRTNVGLVNLEEASAVELRVTFFSASREVLQVRTVRLEPLEYRQLNSVLSGTAAAAVAAGWVEVTDTALPGEGGRFLAYLSVVDNVTGDPVLVMGR